MKVRIREAVKCVSPEMLDEVWQELDYRINTCSATRGAHIEPVLPLNVTCILIILMIIFP
jgi:hypothetical protein